MAFGFWKKLKQATKKIGSKLVGGAKKVIRIADKVNDKFIKPIVKPIATTAAGALFGPAAGAAVRKGLDAVSDGIDLAGNVTRGEKIDWQNTSLAPMLRKH